MKQQVIKFQFREAQNRENYIVSDSNINAVKWIDKYPYWKNSGLIIEGPKSSGKSHLVKVWQKKSNCNIYSSEKVNNEQIDANDKKNLAIENLEKIKNYEFFLHLLNYKKEKKLKYLLTTSHNIISLNIELKDIKSRLLELPKVKITLPSDKLLEELIIKLLKEQGVNISNNLVNYIINRIERTYNAVNLFVKDLNKVSLEKKKNISISLIREILERDD